MPDKIPLPPDKAPYLATLYGKALDAHVADPILGDTLAAEAVARLDYDFEGLGMKGGGEITLPMRARHFDDTTRAFLTAHPAATVLHLGCGLDTRVFRIDPGSDVRWVDVDLPPMIALRRQLYPERPGYRLVGASVTDPAWLDDVPGDLPVLVIAEGLMMYLPEDEGTALLRRIVARFPSGEVAFDGYSGSMVRLVRRMTSLRGMRADLVWGVDDPRDLERQVPGLRLVEDVSFLTMPALVARLAKGPVSAAVHAAMGRLPFYRKLIRHLRYVFP